MLDKVFQTATSSVIAIIVLFILARIMGSLHTHIKNNNISSVHFIE